MNLQFNSLVLGFDDPEFIGYRRADGADDFGMLAAITKEAGQHLTATQFHREKIEAAQIEVA